jgi:hypothetical protein|tara:strand:+ start:191 stop:505 length:315 start_codon:yes stop_codon:yes gene_type:complete
MAGYFFRFVAPKIAKNLTGRRKAKQDIFKTVDKAAGSNVSNQKKSKIKTEAGKIVSKIFDKSEKAKKNIKETKTLIKSAGATSLVGAGAAGTKIIKDKKGRKSR